MQSQDWLDRWQQNRIGFHQGKVNSSLQRYIERFNLRPGDRIFLPLCGKAHDIAWLAGQGFEVIGIELSAIAIRDFFTEFEIEYQRFESGRFVIYKSDNILLFEGDYFDLTAEDLRDPRLVYDRAALIAIDSANRERYCAHMKSLTSSSCDMLLITLEYDQSIMSGPPFSVVSGEVKQHYQDDFEIELLEVDEIVDESPRWRKQGLSSLLEKTYQLTPRERK